MEIHTPLVEDVSELAAQASAQGSVIAFQSTLAAAAQVVERALQREKVAEEAALSLAQQDALHAMSSELRAISEALQGALDSQGRCLMPACTEKKSRMFGLPASLRAGRKGREEKAAPRPTWWYSLVEAVEVLGEGAERMRAIASGQPGDAPSRVLGLATADLLGNHYDRLLGEAERWID
jgi:hypothetical protein